MNSAVPTLQHTMWPQSLCIGEWNPMDLTNPFSLSLVDGMWLYKAEEGRADNKYKSENARMKNKTVFFSMMPWGSPAPPLFVYLSLCLSPFLPWWQWWNSQLKYHYLQFRIYIPVFRFLPFKDSPWGDVSQTITHNNSALSIYTSSVGE